jgi:hypothetical protein
MNFCMSIGMYKQAEWSIQKNLFNVAVPPRLFRCEIKVLQIDVQFQKEISEVCYSYENIVYVKYLLVTHA